MKRRFTCGIDLGGTDIKSGLADRDLNIVARNVVPTGADRGPEAVIETMLDSVRTWIDTEEVLAVGVGSPGPLSPSRGVVLKSVNLPGWINIDIKQAVAEATGLPVVVDNDANVAAYGEYAWVREQDPSDLVLLTLGTGVGSGAVIGGRIFHGHHENASEWGHTIVVPDGEPCKCGQRGCLEQYASASNISRRLRDAIRQGANSSLEAMISSGKTPSAHDVERAAQSGDELAARIWDEACYYLALACVNIQHALNPRRIVLGGGMSRAGDILLKPVRTHYQKLRWTQYDGDAPEIGLAHLTNDAGIIGAAALAWDSAEPQSGETTNKPSNESNRR